MKPKKNPNADLRKNIPLFFAAALCFVVFVTWRVIEFRTYESKYDYEALNVEVDDDEMINAFLGIKKINQTTKDTTTTTTTTSSRNH